MITFADKNLPTRYKDCNRRLQGVFTQNRIIMKEEDKVYINSLTDQEIVKGILDRDTRITRLYLYEKCYPLFKALYTRYYTDCEDCLEFINAIYLYLMIPNEKTGKCYLESFGFGCSFICWLKIVAMNYCHQLYRKRIDVDDSDEEELDDEILAGGDYRQLFRTRVNVISIDGTDQDEENECRVDRLPVDTDTIDTDELDKEDVATVLHLMKNPNYRELIRYRYVKEMTNIETAKILGMTMPNYYNAHKHAKEQCMKVLRKEGLL